MHDIRIASGKEENVVNCQVIDEIENPFSYTVMLCPQGEEDTVRFGIQMDKKEWQLSKRERIQICLPPDTILLLKE